MKITITGPDIVAIVLVIGAFTLRALGINSVTEYVILGIAGAYGLGKVAKAKLPKR